MLISKSLRVFAMSTCATICTVGLHHAAAGVVTTTSYQGTATTTNAANQSFTETYTDSQTAEVFQTVTPGEETSGTNVFGTIQTRADGQLDFSNAVGGIGRGSSASSRTSVRQVVTNDTGQAQDVTFESLILPGSIGLGLFDVAECGIGSFFDCEEPDADDPFAQSVLQRGGPTEAGLSIQVLANGQLVYDFNIMVSIAETGAAAYETDVDDGSVLNGFGVLGDPASNQSLYFGWDTTALSVDMGSLDAGDDLIIDFVVETSFANNADCSFETICVSALAGFGDPIKKVGNVPTNSFALRRFLVASDTIAAPEIAFTPGVNADPVPLPAAAWFMAFGLGGAAVLRRRKAADSIG